MATLPMSSRVARRWLFLVANLDRRNFRGQVLLHDRSRAPGSQGRVAFFNHFDPQGEVAPYVLHHVQALVGCGLSLVFVTTSTRLSPQALQALAPHCWLVARRRNIGLDIGGWPVAMRLYEGHAGLPLAKARQVLVTNDSIFGPLRPLGPVLAHMEDSGADMWGISESAERGLHLQSYFVVFQGRGPAFLSRWLRAFRHDPEREALIARHEVGLSAAARDYGLTLAALQSHEALAALVSAATAAADGSIAAPVRELWTRRAGRINPTHYFWRELITEFGSPYIKRDFLREAARFADGGPSWNEVLPRAAPGYPTALIEGYFGAAT